MSTLSSKNQFSYLRTLCGIDFRSLACFRIGLALILLIDLIGRTFDLRAHYTDFGILPREAIYNFFAVPYTFSFHFSSGSWEYQVFLFAVAIFVALMLLFGYCTKLATFFSWLLLISLHNRNEVILHGGDYLLRAFLFWSIFLPLGKRASLDSLRTNELPKTRNYLSFATVALLGQMVILYEFAAFSKYHPIWFSEGSAIYYALASDHLTTSFGQWLLQFPMLLKCFTFATLILEIVFPFLVFIPFRHVILRLFVISSFWVFHLFALNLTMELGHFPYLCALGWIPFLPSEFWNKLSTKIPTRIPRFTWWKKLPSPPAFSVILSKKWPLRMLSNILVAFFFVYVLLSNFARFYPQSANSFLPSSIRWIGLSLRLDQKWKLFSPHPPKEGGWYVISGTLYNGTEIDLLKGEGPVQWEKPQLVSKTYPNARWRKYFMLLLSETYARHRFFYGQYLCRLWNEERAGLLVHFQIYYLREPTLLSGEPEEAKKLLIWSYKCNGNH